MPRRYWIPLLAMLLTGCTAPEVEVVEVRRGPLAETFQERARTRLPEVHRLSLAVAARVGRVALHPGDRVRAGEELVEVDRVPFETRLQEARATVRELEAGLERVRDDRLEGTALEGARAEVQASEAALEAAAEQVEAERLRMERLQKELARDQALAEQSAITPAALDDSRLDADTARIDWKRQRFYQSAFRALHVAIELGPRLVAQYLEREAFDEQELLALLEKARAAEARAAHELSLARVASPVDGVVLERFEEGDLFLRPGTPLLEVGDLETLEVVAEVLTEDALRLGPGGSVALSSRALEHDIPGTVTRVEPSGFTKVSSLGVEQQRVRVRIRPQERPENLGVAYRLEARFVTDTLDDGVLVPRAAVLTDPGGGRYLFVVRDGGTLERRDVTVRLSGARELALEPGAVEPGERIVRRPDTSLRDGAAVRPISVGGGG